MALMLTVDQGAAVMRNGGVVAYPTEAVWGLGCDPFDRGAVERLLAIKRRPVDKGLILLAAAYELLEPLLESRALPRWRLEAVLESWPGPHTWLMPCLPAMPAWLRGEHATLAVRVSAHPVAAALSAAFGGPIVSSSANRAGEPPPRTREAIDPELEAMLDGVVEGETGTLAAPTPIRDAATGASVRD
jgi:L-threonylcarbamoyladenylate synthase